MSESEVRNYYKVVSLYPEAWPEDHNDHADSSGDEGLVPEPRKPTRVTSRSRFSALEAKRTSVPGAERTKDGLENLVQRDEPDPLGSRDSVITALRRKGISVDTDNKLRMHTAILGMIAN
jgi:exocyst complex component 2